MKELHKKQYTLKIETKTFFLKREKVFCFEQGTLRELLEFSQWLKDEDDVIDWLHYFLNKSGKISRKELKKLGGEKINGIIDYLMGTFGKDFFQKTNKETVEKAPMSSFFAFVMEKTGENLDSLLDLTWEQIIFVSEGIVWNGNQQTKKGRQENQIKFALKKSKEEISDEDALEIARNVERSMDKKV